MKKFGMLVTDWPGSENENGELPGVGSAGVVEVDVEVAADVVELVVPLRVCCAGWVLVPDAVLTTFDADADESPARDEPGSVCAAPGATRVVVVREPVDVVVRVVDVVVGVEVVPEVVVETGGAIVVTGGGATVVVVPGTVGVTVVVVVVGSVLVVDVVVGCVVVVDVVVGVVDVVVVVVVVVVSATHESSSVTTPRLIDPAGTLPAASNASSRPCWVEVPSGTGTPENVVIGTLVPAGTTEIVQVSASAPAGCAANAPIRTQLPKSAASAGL